MHYGQVQNEFPRLPSAMLLMLAGIYLLAGITGHDPWKTEDAVHIGIAHDFLVNGDWLFPHIANEPWPHTAPLYHWIAALLGRALNGLIVFHDAARLTTTLFSVLFLIALNGAARTIHGKAAGDLAPLLAMGTLGLLLPMHEAQPAVAGLAFAALAYWGGGLILQGQTHGALLLGTGLGLSFPAHGLTGLLMSIAVLLAPILRRNWNSLALSLLIALPLILAWPLAVSSQAPELWSLWWQHEIAEAIHSRNLPGSRHLEQLLWASWPVLPLALWTIWLQRRQCIVLTIPLLGTLLTLTWFLTGSSRTQALLPLLLPLVIIASAGVGHLRRGAANAFDWFGIMSFSFFAVLIWLGASAQALGWPPRIANNFAKLAPGHVADYSWAALAFATTISLAWIACWRLPRAPWRASLHWAAGTTLMWALTATLWMSWIDHGKSYRGVAESLRTTLPRDADCLERVGVGATHRAALDYFVGIRTTSPASKQHCAWRLIIGDTERITPSGWTEHWQGHRPGDRKERWYLERRAEKGR